MNQIQLVFRCFKTVFVVMLLSLTASNAYAEEKECWANFFEHAQYEGKRLHIEGPAQLENLNKVNGEDWNQRIHSIKVGPKAKVTVYQNPRFELTLTEMAKKPDLMRAWGITEQDIKEDSELIFNANDMIHDLGDFSFHKKIRSLKVECI
ncbi:beta/gamma crystallin domain-containing protein [Methyloglobulus sp.]|uniref:beta/gamma crystallin domain-containing protein n=1 Tax=Methyloglobulus sp. TaxID=2518622 RepID=UPI0032B8175F